MFVVKAASARLLDLRILRPVTLRIVVAPGPCIPSAMAATPPAQTVSAACSPGRSTATPVPTTRRTAAKYSKGATTGHVQDRPNGNPPASTEPPGHCCRPFASRGSKRAWVTKWVTTGHDRRRRHWTFVDPWHSQTSPAPARWLDLIEAAVRQMFA